MQTYDEGPLRIIRVGPLGPFANNAYLIANAESGEAFLVDMPVESSRVLEAAAGPSAGSGRSLRIAGVLLTHTHPDHWAEYDTVKAATGAPVFCHPAERIMPAEKIDRPLADGDELTLGGVTVRAVHTPGHTPGSTCFVVEGAGARGKRYLISGDTLFPGGPGHSDSPQALQEMIHSITQRLYTLPDDTPVLPGHGEGTTIGRSRQEYAVFASRPHAPELCGDVLWESS